MTATSGGIRGYLRAMWRCRYFWLSLVRMDLRTRYRRSILGVFWSLLHPLAMTAILTAVFGLMFKQPIRYFAPFVLSGLAFWNFISNAIRDGCSCLFQGEAYIRQYPAPIAIYPLRATLGAGFHFLLALGVVLLLTGVLHGFSNLLVLISLVPSLLLLFLLGWSLAVLAGFTTVYFPDTQHLAEVALQILFYATPIMYPPDFLQRENLAQLFEFNPLTALLHLLRDPILLGRMPSLGSYAISSLTLLLAGGAAVLTLGRLQRRLIFQL
jgi:ABC-type polysaccharide/polyol phosphate export permease